MPLFTTSIIYIYYFDFCLYTYIDVVLVLLQGTGLGMCRWCLGDACLGGDDGNANSPLSLVLTGALVGIGFVVLIFNKAAYKYDSIIKVL